jgi:thioredoxin-like negative regulator of GroEL
VRRWVLTLVVAAAACSTTATPLQRGITLSQRGQDAAALATFDEAIRRSPESAPAYVSRGVVRARLGDVDGAIADYTRAHELGAPADVVLFNRCQALISKHDYQRAIADCTAVLAENPSHPGASFTRGNARWLAGDAEQARADWVRAIEGEPDSRQKAQMRAALDSLPPLAAPRSASESGVASEAVLRPFDSRALAARGLERELKGDRLGAIADLRAALAGENDPEQQQGLRNLLQLLDTP